jgi:hypothetical protein
VNREHVWANAFHRAIADGITRDQVDQDQLDPERVADGGGLNLLPRLGVGRTHKCAYG